MATAPHRHRIGGLTLWLDTAEVKPEEIVRWLDPDDATARVLKSDRRTRVVLVRSGERRWVVKFYALPTIKRWLYNLFRRTPAWREWSGSLKLRGAGVRGVEPVALADRLPGRWSQALLTPFVEGLPLNHYLKESSITARARAALARRVGEQIGGMTASGIVNRDHKAANLIVDPACAAGGQPPVILDPGGLRRRRSVRQVHRMLALLYGSASMLHPISAGDAMRCLRAAARADPTLGDARALFTGTRLEYALLTPEL